MVTQCTRPEPVPVEDLVAYAYGEATPELVAHIETCPACREAAGEYTQLQRELGARLYRFDCPTPQTLGEYTLHLLAAEEQTRVAGHVRDCPLCAAELRTLRDFLASELAATVPSLMTRIKRTIATLVAPPAAAYAGVRGAGAATRTYRAGAIVITVDPGAGARRARLPVTGLIWREGGAMEELAGSQVRLIAADGTAHTTQLGALGDFDWEAVAPGTYRLEAALADHLVVVEELRVGG